MTVKRCPFCHRVVWFCQKKCYLDAKSKKPCHAYCWVWNLTKDESKNHLVILSPNMGMLRKAKPEVKKVEDDTWRKGKGIEK